MSIIIDLDWLIFHSKIKSNNPPELSFITLQDRVSLSSWDKPYYQVIFSLMVHLSRVLLPSKTECHYPPVMNLITSLYLVL